MPLVVDFEWDQEGGVGGELTRLLAARVAMMSTVWDGLVWYLFWEGYEEGVMIKLSHWISYSDQSG